jgi:hypothetical protein
VVAAVTLCGCSVLGVPQTPGGAGSPARGASAGSAGSAGSAPQRSSAGPAGGAGAVASADRTHEVPTPAGPERASRAWASPRGAVRAFATAYINWTAATVASRLRTLAHESVGQARATLELQAREVASDTELHRGRIANSGTVETVGPLAGHGNEYAVVTRERTSAADDAAYRGLAPEWHVSVATVTRVGGGRWVLSGWQPES